MQKVIDTRDHAADERLDRWLALVAGATAPQTITVENAGSFHGELRAAQFGAVSMARVVTTPTASRRTAALIRQHDPETMLLVLCQHGDGGVTQSRKNAKLQTGDMTCFSTGRPYSTVATGAEGSPVVHAVTAAFPRTLLPLKADDVDRAAAITLSSRDGGPAALLHGFLRGLATSDTHYRPEDAARLGNVLADLLSVTLAHVIDRADALPHDVDQRTQLRQAKAFILQHLADPALTPAAVAAAHQMSRRTLYRLFEDEDSGVARWIRAQRLERFRRALIDPATAHLPVDAVVARCGLGHRVCRHLFHTIHGMSPGQYRQMHSPHSNS